MENEKDGKEDVVYKKVVFIRSYFKIYIQKNRK